MAKKSQINKANATPKYKVRAYEGGPLVGHPLKDMRRHLAHLSSLVEPAGA